MQAITFVEVKRGVEIAGLDPAKLAGSDITGGLRPNPWATLRLEAQRAAFHGAEAVCAEMS